MTEPLVAAQAAGASPQHWHVASDLQTPTLADADNWYVLFQAQGDRTTAYGAGFGPSDDQMNTHGWSDLDLQNGGGTAIDADYRYRVYRDSRKDDLIAQSGKFGSAPLRSAVSASRKDKQLMSALHSKVAGDASYLTFEASPRSSSTGDVVDVANSADDYGVAYSEIPTSKG